MAEAAPVSLSPLPAAMPLAGLPSSGPNPEQTIVPSPSWRQAGRSFTGTGARPECRLDG